MNKRLRRSRNSMLAGVCGGLADWLGWDPTVIRVLWVIITTGTFPMCLTARKLRITGKGGSWLGRLWMVEY